MFQATSEKTYEIGNDSWRITVMADEPGDLVNQIQAFEDWWQARQEELRLAEEKALNPGPTDEEIDQILDEASED